MSRCPRCHSDESHLHGPTRLPDGNAEWCTDPWHSTGVVPTPPLFDALLGTVTRWARRTWSVRR